MGSGRPSLFQVVTRWAQLGTVAPTVLCPCLEGLPPDFAFTIGILPVHDANALLLEELARADGTARPDFAGVYLADPFRRLDDVLDRVEAAGIRGVVNLPTVVPFLRDGSNRIFQSLHRIERTAIDHAARRGFDCRLVTTAPAPGRPEEVTLNQFVFPARSGQAGPGRERASPTDARVRAAAPHPQGRNGRSA
jgi:hypothetical protein